MIGYGKFKDVFEATDPSESATLVFKDKNDKYVITKYSNGITFQRIGDNPSGEIRFNTIDELYITRTVDDIILRDQWSNVVDIIFDDAFSVVYDKDDIKDLYNVEV